MDLVVASILVVICVFVKSFGASALDFDFGFLPGILMWDFAF